MQSVAELAKRVGCSPSYLYRTAAEHGVDLAHLVRTVRLLHALELKRSRNLRWTQVAVYLGHGSSSSLTNFFQRHLGVTPSQAAQHEESEWLRRAISLIVAE